MNVYLVQHAEAEPKEVDASRPLSEEGRRHAEQVAALAGRMGLYVHQIRHSGKTRAEQTASIIGAALDPPGGVTEAPGLGPEDDVRPVAKQLSRLTEPAMLVGHLPFMERLAGQMLVGDPERAVVRFHNAGIVCLSREEDGWQVSWIVTPEVAAAGA
jgi:phosphohistidine phosphatase